MAGCKDEGGDEEPPPGTGTPTGSILDKDVGTPTGTGWSVETVDQGAVGTQARVAVLSDGSAAIAYFADKATDGEDCEEISMAGAETPKKKFWPLYFSTDESGSWQRETVAEILHVALPIGLDLTLDPGGTPVITTMVGEPVAQIRYCGANDVGLLSRTTPGQWSTEIAVANSGEAASGEAGSDYGYVVGWWPSVAYDASGNPAISYRDVHGGAVLQNDDLNRADLEIAWGNGGGWGHIPVDIGRGAGDFTDIVFDGQGNPYILYYNGKTDSVSERKGVWVTRSLDSGATWQFVHLHFGNTEEGMSMVWHEGDQTVYAAYFNSGKGLPVIAKLVDSDQFEDQEAGWERETLGDTRYDEGRHPSLAISPNGTLAIAYYRCTLIKDGIGNCNTNDDAVVFGYRDAGFWQYEVVDEGGIGFCGAYTTLAIGGDGRPAVGYQCAVQKDDGTFTNEVRVARRSAL